MYRRFILKTLAAKPRLLMERGEFITHGLVKSVQVDGVRQMVEI